MNGYIEILAPKLRSMLVAVAVLLGSGIAVSAQHELSRDVLTGNLFPPDVVLRHADQIGLGRNQRDAVLKAMQEAKGILDEGQQKLREANQRLGATLDDPSIDEQQMLKHLDDVLRAERAIKRGRLTMLARVKNQLSAEQQEKLRATLRQQPSGDGEARSSQRTAPQTEGADDARLREDVSAGMQKVRAGVERWRKEGRNPRPVMDSLQGFTGLMHNGKLLEAKQLLDQALEKLESEPREANR